MPEGRLSTSAVPPEPKSLSSWLSSDWSVGVKYELTVRLAAPLASVAGMSRRSHCSARSCKCWHQNTPLPVITYMLPLESTEGTLPLIQMPALAALLEATFSTADCVNVPPL